MSEEKQEWSKLPGVMDVAWDRDFARAIVEERRLRQLAEDRRIREAEAKAKAGTREERKRRFQEWLANNPFVPKGPNKELLERTVVIKAAIEERDKQLPTYEKSCAHIDSLRKRGIPFNYPACPPGHEKWAPVPVADRV